MFNLLVISNDIKPHVVTGLQLRTRVCGYGASLCGEGYDHILQIDEPKNELEKEWYAQVATTRLLKK